MCTVRAKPSVCEHTDQLGECLPEISGSLDAGDRASFGYKLGDNPYVHHAPHAVSCLKQCHAASYYTRTRFEGTPSTGSVHTLRVLQVRLSYS